MTFGQMQKEAFDRLVAVEAQQPFLDLQHLRAVVGGKLSQIRLRVRIPQCGLKLKVSIFNSRLDRKTESPTGHQCGAHC